MSLQIRPISPVVKPDTMAPIECRHDSIRYILKYAFAGTEDHPALQPGHDFETQCPL